MINYFVRHPTAATLVMIGLLVIGLFSFPQLRRETFPQIAPSKIQVTVVWPGSRPEDVETAICQRVEDAIDTVNNVDEVICEALEGVATTTVEKTDAVTLDRFTSDVKTAVDGISDFPENVERPVVTQLGRTDFVASVAITGPTDRVQLKAFAEQTKDRMELWGGIPKVEVLGFSDHEIRIELSRESLRSFNISTADIARAIQRQSLDLPSGELETGERDLLIRYAGERRRVDEFRDLVVVSSANGGQVALGDVATITDRFTLDEARIEFNAKPAAVLSITKTNEQDTLDVISRVQSFLEDARAKAPPGITMAITNDVSSIVQDRLSLLIRNAGQGLALVFLVLWLFFGLRYSFWVAAGLPVSFAGAFFLMVAVGYSINMLTMVGLLIVIGLLMDDAIVIAENVASQYGKGKKPAVAAIDGASQVLPSVFASFATTACIFGSLAFLKGDIGQILRVVPVVMLFVLIVSLVEAFLILPNHLYHALEKSGVREGRVQQWVDNGVNWLRDRAVVPMATWAVKWRYLTFGCAIGALMLAVAAVVGGLVKFSPFPDLDGNVMEARIMLPQGTPLKRTEDVVARIDAALERVNQQLKGDQPGGQDLVRNVTHRFNFNTDAGETGPHVATVIADLLDSETRTSRIDDVIRLWSEETGELADIVNLNFTEGTFGPGGRDIDIRLTGRDLDQLSAAAKELSAWLQQYRGVYNLMDDLRPGKPELRITLRDGASTLGIDGRTIADQLRASFYGFKVDEIQLGRESYEINVSLDRASRDSLADIDNFTITAADGSQIPLSVVAEVEEGRGYSRIRRVDGRRTVTILGELDKRFANSTEILNDTRKRFLPELKQKYPDVSSSFEGSNADASRTQRSMLSGFVLGLIGVYLLLSFQFRSYLEPFIVMIIIPFAFIGAIGGHMLMGLDFTMPSMLGFVALAGIVVNDSILLVNFIKHYHGDTQSVAEAAPLASGARFRAILLTSLTTIVGLMPLLTETSLQAQVLIPLVTSLAFGLLATTVLVLIIVPAVYTILDDFGAARID
jgi:HAE1 family hydrophobic/amphiphilic exporter-1